MGGNTLFPNFLQRFQQDLRPYLNDVIEEHVTLPADPINHAWKAAKMFMYDVNASGTLANVSVSREEFLEHGHRITLQRFNDW